MLMILAMAMQPNDAVRAEEWARKAKPIATCSATEECDEKWRRASDWVRANTQFQFAVDRPDLLATYGAIYANTDLSFVLARRKRADGTTEIVARAWCGNVVSCNPKPKTAIAALTKATK